MDEPMTFRYYEADTSVREAGATQGYLYVWSGEPGPARYIPLVMVEDGEGNGFFESTGEWGDCTVISAD